MLGIFEKVHSNCEVVGDERVSDTEGKLEPIVGFGSGLDELEERCADGTEDSFHLFVRRYGLRVMTTAQGPEESQEGQHASYKDEDRSLHGEGTGEKLRYDWEGLSIEPDL
jgi:hypothetical protein